MKLQPAHPAPGKLWCVRGTADSGDVSIVVEHVSKVEAEAAGWRRGINVVIVTEATPEDVMIAEATKTIYRYTPLPRLKCWGRAVTNNQAAFLVVCALAVIVLDLRAWHVPMGFHARHATAVRAIH